VCVGYYQLELRAIDGIAATQTCAQCSAGRYSNIDNAQSCSLCTPGHYSLSAATACVRCPPGQISSAMESQSCYLCPSGTRAVLDNSTNVNANATAADGGATRCESCLVGILFLTVIYYY
jgi:hypothetical protein